MSNIIQLINHRFPDDIIERAAKRLNENTVSLKKSIDTGISIIMISILLKVEQKGLKKILNIAQDKFKINDDFIQKSRNPFEIELSNPNEGVVGKYGFLLHLLFDEKSNKIIDNYAGFSEIKSISAHHVLSAIIPVILSMVNKNSVSEQEQRVTTYILKQKENILKSLPLDKDFNPALFFPTAKCPKELEHSTIPQKKEHVNLQLNENTVQKNILVFILLFLIALNLLWWFFKRYR